MACTAATFAGQPETGSFTDAAGIAAGLAKYAGQVPASLFLHSADRRQHHWRVGGFACICLRGRRPALAQALSPSRRDGCARLLPRVVRPDRGRGRAGADPELAAWYHHWGRADPCGRLAAIGNSSFAVVQRQGGARLLGERALDQPVYRLGDRRPGHALGGRGGLGAVPVHPPPRVCG